MIYMDCSCKDALHNLDTILFCEELVTGKESYQFSKDLQAASSAGQ